jgi:phospholipid/cholesterol/gamma-HCH transport system substrate-binding protein
MDKTKNKRAVIVGIFVLVGILFLAAGILTIGNLRNTFSKKLHVSAVFDDVGGLQKGNNIWFSGVKIGTIKTVSFLGNQRVKVVLNIDQASREYIRKDAKVKISTDGLIGNKILVITGGSPRREAIEEGDTLGIEKTLSSEEMMNTLQENNKNLLDITKDVRKMSKKISGGEGNIGKIINEDDIYTNLSAAAISLRKASEKAGKMVESLNALAAGFNTKGNFVHSMSTDTTLYPSLKASVMHLNQMADSASIMVSNLKAATANPNTPAGVMLHDEAAGAQLKSTISNLSSSSKKLDQDLEALQYSWPFKKGIKKSKKK